MSDPASNDPPPDETPAGPPIPYVVVYSGRVRDDLEALLRRAVTLGRGPETLDAAREITRRLSVYPQFGQPLRDLQREPSQIWIGVVEPLVVQYSIHDDIRQVWVVVPIVPLPNSGL